MDARAVGIQGQHTVYGPVVEIVYENGHVDELKHIIRHSPTGMSWGYAGSGPADLALSILTYITKSKHKAERHYMSFKFAFVAVWPQEKFFVPLVAIRNWLREQAQ